MNKIKVLKLFFKKTFIVLFIVGCFSPIFGQRTSRLKSVPKKSAPVEILSSDKTGLTVSISPQKWSVESREIDSENFTQLDFFGADFSGKIGHPQIPYYVILIGIPIGAEVQYQILGTSFEPLNRTKPIPYPYFKKVNEVIQPKYDLDETVYNSRNPFPAEIVKIDEIGFFRDQRVARILVAGAQYFPEQQQIVKHNRVMLRLQFNGGPFNTNTQSIFYSPNEEEIYKAAILNYEQSIPWRKARASSSGSINNSSFAIDGTYYRFTINEEGIYKIDGNLLASHNINLNDIDPAKIKIFNNGGRELPRGLNAPRPDGLMENAIIVDDGSDGSFDPDDFILFYGRGVDGWTYNSLTEGFSHYINHYGFDNVYWLSLAGNDRTKNMAQVNSGQLTGNIIQEYQGLAFVEEELFNPVRSGLNFFGRRFSIDEISRSQSYNLDLPNVSSSASAQLKLRFASLNDKTHSFAISVNNRLLGTSQFNGLSLGLGQYLRMHAPGLPPFEAPNMLQPGMNNFEFTYSHTSNFGQAFLDWFEILYPAHLNAIDDELAFTAFPDSGLKTYRVANFSGNSVQLFDVTDYADVKQILNADFSNGNITFADFQDPNLPKHYLAVTPSNFKTVQALERIELNDLRSSILGAEFVIITHEDFFAEALRLESLRENLSPGNRLETEVVLMRDIYNNFSGGLADPTAIRDFLKYAVDTWSPRPAYVLLLGDGDYDYKNILSGDDKNWVPTFQTDDLANSALIAELDSRTSDSWFTYVIGTDRFMDLAIGRINAQTPTDAANVVDKIIAYEIGQNYGAWRNTITFVADDELNKGGLPLPGGGDARHVRETEKIAEGYIPKSFNLKKIYLTEYPKVISASVGGVTKPAAQEDLINQINKGTLIVNYIGHGNPTQWAHEVVFHQSDNDRVQNQDKLIFFVAATCDWALFDNPQKQSQAEELLLYENRGAIAILSSTRLVFASPNEAFNRNFYNRLFPSDGFGETTRIGDAFVLTRTASSSGNLTNDEKFHIYGDPTLRLAIAKYEARITNPPDSILALSTIEISGEIVRDGQVWSDFNGTALVNTFDSKKFVENFPEGGGGTQKYFLPGNSIYRGTVPVKNGLFSAKFIVPKDISYGGQLARISTYFWDEDTDGVGFTDNILVSSSSSSLVDTKGPELKLYFQDHENFTSGDIIGESAALVIDLIDTVSGINIAGEIGHQITLTIDPDQETCLSELNEFLGVSSIDLTDFFSFNEGEHLSGQIRFPLQFPKEVEIGGQIVLCETGDGEDRHTIVLKAWDNANNSTTASIEVLVAHEEGLVLREVMNYPNPMAEKTTFTFSTNQDVEVEIKIYTVSGQLIRRLEYPFAQSGFNMIEWDGLDEEGDRPANGVYLYKLTTKTPGMNGTARKVKMGRLAIIR